MRRNEGGRPASAGGERRRAQHNRLLVALPAGSCMALEPYLDPVPVPLGVLWEQGDRLGHIYFPIDCIISLVHRMDDGASSQIAIVGNEGLIDASVLIGSDIAPRRAVVGRAGYAHRIPTGVLRDAFDRDSAVAHLLLRYFNALLFQIEQTAACNRFHSIDQQFCRFLLSMVDRMRSNKVAATHEMMASTLGISREGITRAIGRLKREELIRCEQSIVAVLDRRGLERRACECYTAIRQQHDALRPSAQSPSPPLRTQHSITPRSAS